MNAYLASIPRPIRLGAAVLIGTIVVSLVGYYALFISAMPHVAAPSADDMNVQEIMPGETYRSRTLNLSFVTPMGWHGYAPEEVGYPATYGTPLLTLRNDAGTCAIAYARVPTDDDYEQMAFAHRVFTTHGSQIDTGWYAPMDPAGDRPFYGHDRHPVAGEVQIGYFKPAAHTGAADARPLFVLYEPGGGTVAEDCERAYLMLLESLEEYYEPITLTEASRGVLFGIADPNMNEAYPYKNSFIFKSDADGIFYEVMKSRAARYGSHAVLLNGTFYFTDDGFYTVNPFAKKEVRIPGPVLPAVPEGGVINDMTVAGGKFFYLFGPVCHGIRCESALYTLPLSGGTPERLVELTSAHTLYGVYENEFYMMSGYSDAGCFSAHFSSVNLHTNAITKRESFGGCGDYNEGAPELAAYEESVAAYRTYADKVNGNLTMVEYLRVEGGELRVPAEGTTAQNLGLGSYTRIRAFR